MKHELDDDGWNSDVKCKALLTTDGGLNATHEVDAVSSDKKVLTVSTGYDDVTLHVRGAARPT